MRATLALRAILIATCLSGFAHAETTTLNGRVVGIADGDTLTLLDRNNTQHKIRLGQIDAPEVGHGRNKPPQAFGERSKQSLSDLVFGRQVAARCRDRSYERLVCQVFVGPLNVNLEQVQRGMAWAEPRYVMDLAYYRAQNQATAGHVGLWRDNNPTPPWLWRKNER